MILPGSGTGGNNRNEEGGMGSRAGTSTGRGPNRSICPTPPSPAMTTPESPSTPANTEPSWKYETHLMGGGRLPSRRAPRSRDRHGLELVPARRVRVRARPLVAARRRDPRARARRPGDGRRRYAQAGAYGAGRAHRQGVRRVLQGVGHRGGHVRRDERDPLG